MVEVRILATAHSSFTDRPQDDAKDQIGADDAQ